MVLRAVARPRPAVGAAHSPAGAGPSPAALARSPAVAARSPAVAARSPAEARSPLAALSLAAGTPGSSLPAACFSSRRGTAASKRPGPPAWDVVPAEALMQCLQSALVGLPHT